MASPVIRIESMNIEFNSAKVLKDINLTLSKGEIFVLIGPSGQGKSVLLKLMAGLFPPTTGRLWIEGHDFWSSAEGQKDHLRRHMGMLFQKNALFDSLTAAENVEFPLIETTSMGSDERQKKVDYFLEEVGLTSAHQLYPDEISGGMQKRLGIARALALNPEIVFYDDPTAGLDPITSRKIIDLILRLQKEKNSTVVAITNDMNRAFQLAHRIGLVIRGELIITGSPEATQNHPDPRVQQFIRGEQI